MHTIDIDQTSRVGVSPSVTLTEELVSRMNAALSMAQLCRSLGRWRDADGYVRLASEFRRLRQEAEEGMLCPTQTLTTLEQ